MPFNGLEKKRIENALASFLAKRRPPPHIRKELDFGYHLSGQSVELIEIRPQWDDPAIIIKRPFAKATYVRTEGCWKIFWMRASLKWQGYEPNPTVGSIDQFLAVVDRDPHGYFWGWLPLSCHRLSRRKSNWPISIELSLLASPHLSSGNCRPEAEIRRSQKLPMAMAVVASEAACHLLFEL